MLIATAQVKGVCSDLPRKKPLFLLMGDILTVFFDEKWILFMRYFLWNSDNGKKFSSMTGLSIFQAIVDVFNMQLWIFTSWFKNVFEYFIVLLPLLVYFWWQSGAITARFLRGCYNFGIINRNDLNFQKFNFPSIDICIWSELFYVDAGQKLVRQTKYIGRGKFSLKQTTFQLEFCSDSDH